MLKDKAVLYTPIPREVHDALRTIAFKERRSIADVSREAIDEYLKKRGLNPKEGG
jgi:hypothetical protein